MSKASLTNKVSEVIIFQFWAFTLYYKSFKYMVNHSRQVLSKKIGYITQPNPYTYRPPSPASRILSVVGFKKYLQGKFFDEEAILDELSEKLREVSCAVVHLKFFKHMNDNDGDDDENDDGEEEN